MNVSKRKCIKKKRKKGVSDKVRVLTNVSKRKGKKVSPITKKKKKKGGTCNERITQTHGLT
jgi:hypothetical protein